MTILGKRNYKQLGAVTIGFAGLLLTSVAVAGYGPGDKDGWHDDDDRDGKRGKDGWHDDDGKDGWNDDDDDGKKGGKNRNDREPRFEDKGTSLQAEVEVRGLKKNQRVRADIEATAEVDIECRRRGGYKGKGKKSFSKELDIELEGVEFVPRNKVYGNRIEIEVETEKAKNALDGKYGYDGGCPRGYDRRIKKVGFVDVRVDIGEGKRKVVTWLCTFDRETRDGKISPRDVDCHKL